MILIFHGLVCLLWCTNEYCLLAGPLLVDLNASIAGLYCIWQCSGGNKFEKLYKNVEKLKRKVLADFETQFCNHSLVGGMVTASQVFMRIRDWFLKEEC